MGRASAKPDKISVPAHVGFRSALPDLQYFGGHSNSLPMCIKIFRGHQADPQKHLCVPKVQPHNHLDP